MTLLSKFALAGISLSVAGLVCFSLVAPLTAEEKSTSTDNSPAAPVVDQPGEESQQVATNQEETPSLIDISRAAEAKIRKAMQTKIDASLTQTELGEFVEFLKEKGGIPIWINEIALEEEGITVNKKLTDDLQGVTIEQALSWTLTPLNMTWLIEDETVKVTTQVDAEERLFTRTYDAHALLSLPTERNSNCAKMSIFAEGGHGCSEPPGFDLLQIIQQETSGPWMEIDGSGGTVTELRGTMTVRHTWKSHQEIRHLLSVLDVFASGKSVGASIAPRAESYPTNLDRKIHAALTKLTSVEMAEVPLSSLAGILAKRHGLRIRILKPALAEEGIGLDEPITLSVKDTSLGSLLHILLEPLALTYYISDGVLWITTEIDAEEELYTVVYNVRDLVNPHCDLESIVELIQQETSGPWVEIDGTGGTASDADPIGALVIRQTHKVHNEIAQLLTDLRKTVRVQSTIEPIPEPDPDAMVTQVYDLSKMNAATDLVTAIPRFVTPDSWSDKKKSVAIQKVGESLVIRQTRAMHEQIERFLQQFGYYTRSGFGADNN